MKKLLMAFLLIMVSSSIMAQTIDKIVDNKITSKADSIGTVIKVLTDRVAVIESKQNSGDGSSVHVEYDTTFVFSRTTTSATAVNIDTLIGATNLYQFTCQAVNAANGDVGSVVFTVSIRNTNGTYTVVRTVNNTAWSGQTTVSACKVSVVKVGSLPVLQITGVGGTTVKWTITKSKLL